jgi:hypothetical protein
MQLYDNEGHHIASITATKDQTPVIKRIPPKLTQDMRLHQQSISSSINIVQTVVTTLRLVSLALMMFALLSNNKYFIVCYWVAFFFDLINRFVLLLLPLYLYLTYDPTFLLIVRGDQVSERVLLMNTLGDKLNLIILYTGAILPVYQFYEIGLPIFVLILSAVLELAAVNTLENNDVVSLVSHSL